jgi:hypothetical protein
MIDSRAPIDDALLDRPRVHECFHRAQTNFSHARMKKFHFLGAGNGPIIAASGAVLLAFPPL